MAVEKLSRKQQIIRNEFTAVLIAVKKSTHWPDFDKDDYGQPAFNCVTFGANDDLTEWDWQSGDNSFSGGAYFYPHWGVVYFRPRTNCREIALEALEQILSSIGGF